MQTTQFTTIIVGNASTDQHVNKISLPPPLSAHGEKGYDPRTDFFMKTFNLKRMLYQKK
jgi:hypothetical protein